MKGTINFSYKKYNSILLLKLFEVIVKKFIKFILLSKDNQKKRFFWERLGLLPNIIRKSNQAEWIWVHANSIGEVNACVSLIQLIKNKYPYNPILITTTNFSADQRAAQLNIADAVTFFPYDTPLIIKKYLKIFNPLCVIIVECDIWPNFVKMCKKNSIPVLVISGIFAEGNRRSLGSRYLYNYKFNLSTEALNNIDRFYMQTFEDAQRLSYLMGNYKEISVTGDLKFSILNGRLAMKEINYYRNIFDIKDKDSVFIAGNIHKEEFEMILDAFRIVKQKISDVIMILAPRFIRDISYIEPLLSKKKLSYIKRTVLNEQKRFNEDIILLDTIGELAKIYALGKVAFVGGSLVYLGDAFGGHNILEPSVLGVPVLFGPYMHNFQNLSELFLKYNAAVKINNTQELADWVFKIITDKSESQRIISNAMMIFEENRDVAKKTFFLIDGKLKQLLHN